MRSVQVRIPLGLGQRLQDIIFARGRHENVAFALVSHAQAMGAPILLVRHVLTLDEGAYLHDTSCGASWRGSAMIPVIDLAMRERLGVVLVHAHDFGHSPRLSHPDIESANRILPMLRRRVPERPHGSIVLSHGDAGGILAFPGEQLAAARVSIRWMGSSIVDWPVVGKVSGQPSETDIFDRQALVIGDQGALSNRRIAVVGLCGGGSHMVQQLAHSGAGTIIGIDADFCDRTNGHRNIGMRPGDAKKRAMKTQVMERLVRSIGTGSTFIGVDARVPDPKAIEALLSADVIVGCVDNLHARADLQEIAWRNVIPYIDIGVSIRALKGSASSPRVAVGGNVYVFIPGGFCGWCCGFLSEEKLRAERNGREDRSYFENKKGEAQVVSFNGVVASQAVSEVIQLVSGFRGSSLDPQSLLRDDGSQRGALKLDGRRGTLEDWGGRRRGECPCCSSLLGAGSVAWGAVASAPSMPSSHDRADVAHTGIGSTPAADTDHQT